MKTVPNDYLSNPCVRRRRIWTEKYQISHKVRLFLFQNLIFLKLDRKGDLFERKGLANACILPFVNI